MLIASVSILLIYFLFTTLMVSVFLVILLGLVAVKKHRSSELYRTTVWIYI